MTAGDPLNGSQTDAGSLKVLVRMQSSEGSEELFNVCHVEARAVVLNIVCGDAPVDFTSELDPGLGFLTGELPGVSQQVPQERPQKLRISLRRQSVHSDEIHHPVRVVRAKLSHHLVCQPRQVNGFSSWFSSRQSC